MAHEGTAGSPMIKRNRWGCLERTCDSCGTIEADPGYVVYKVSWEAAKAKGWTARQLGPNWKHDCPKCGG